MMHESINLYSNNVPKSPIREILELEPETAQFGKPEKLADGRRVRCTLEIIGKGVFKGELFVCFFLVKSPLSLMDFCHLTNFVDDSAIY